MIKYKQVDCFKPIFVILHYISLWPRRPFNTCYNTYTVVVVILFFLIYNILFTISFLNAPYEIELIISETIFYFTVISVATKMLTILLKRKKFYRLTDILESDIFQPTSEKGKEILRKAKRFNKLYFIFIASTSSTCFTFLVIHSLMPLHLTVTNYYFLSKEVKEEYLIYIYSYQMIGIFIHMLTHISMEALIGGIIKFAEAQLDILYDNLSHIKISDQSENSQNEALKRCINHFLEIEK